MKYTAWCALGVWLLVFTSSCTGRILSPREWPQRTAAAGSVGSVAESGSAGRPGKSDAGAVGGSAGGVVPHVGAVGGSTGGVVPDAGAVGGSTGGVVPDAGASRPPAVMQERLYGVTIDSLQPMADILDSLQALARKPTARIVFDANLSARDYVQGVQRIHAVSSVMGELVDSIDVAAISASDYSARTLEYLDALGDNVDLWEIGNEINGEWLGDTNDVRDKMVSAFRAVHGRGKPTALTLFYNQNCFMRADHEMFSWAEANVPDEMKQGLDYVFISFYEDNCKVPTPDWNAVFSRLARMFPSSKVGFGECGTVNTANKAAYVDRYYGLKVAEPAYVGGYFWWYFRQDMLPHTAPLWAVLNDNIAMDP